jgi:hypothetical protein
VDEINKRAWCIDPVKCQLLFIIFIVIEFHFLKTEIFIELIFKIVKSFYKYKIKLKSYTIISIKRRRAFLTILEMIYEDKNTHFYQLNKINKDNWAT